MATIDHNTFASSPGKVRLSRHKLSLLQPEMDSLIRWLRLLMKTPIYPGRSRWLKHIEEHLWYGDSRAAVVVRTSPLLVAAYTDELDCVAILHFDDRFAKDYDLQIGSRLLTVNTYYNSDAFAGDLRRGPAASGRWGNFAPFIADFLSDDLDRIQERKNEISDSEWDTTEEHGKRWLYDCAFSPREGAPLLCGLAGKSTGRTEVSIVTSFDVFKHLVVLLGLLAFTIGSMAAAVWPGVIIFGGFSVLVAWETARLCNRKIVSSSFRESVKASLLWIGSMAIALLFGIGGAGIQKLMSGVGPGVAIWLGSFASTLALYSFRGDQKNDFPTFPLWALYCAMMSSVSLGLSLLPTR
jgi:hypothetical protein